MILSTDFVLRATGTESLQIAHHKDEIDSETFTTNLNYCGGHQIFIDTSRCSKLLPSVFAYIGQICIGLVFLDVSYTSIDSIKCISAGCKVLRGLNIAGVKLISYDDLCAMETLEILNVRRSSFRSTWCVSKNILLRSLDLGETDISELDHLSALTHLEELQLDHCHRLNFTLIRSTIQQLPNLRLLNMLGLVTRKEVAKTITNMQLNIALVERDPALDFFKAVLDDDVERIRYFISLGYDIDMKTPVSFNRIAAKAWYLLATQSGVRAPFFLVDHPLVHLRPTASHLALYFRCIASLRALVQAGANVEARAALLSVEIVEDGLLVGNKSPAHLTKNMEAEQRPQRCHSLVKEIGYLKLHRFLFAERMATTHKKRPTPAEVVALDRMCEAGEEELKDILDGKWLRRQAMMHAGGVSGSSRQSKSISLNLLPQHPSNSADWRKHSLVSKLHGPPTAVTVRCKGRRNFFAQSVLGRRAPVMGREQRREEPERDESEKAVLKGVSAGRWTSSLVDESASSDDLSDSDGDAGILAGDTQSLATTSVSTAHLFQPQSAISESGTTWEGDENIDDGINDGENAPWAITGIRGDLGVFLEKEPMSSLTAASNRVLRGGRYDLPSHRPIRIPPGKISAVDYRRSLPPVLDRRAKLIARLEDNHS